MSDVKFDNFLIIFEYINFVFFLNIYKVLFIFIIMFVFIVFVECLFSVMKRIKLYLWVIMGQERFFGFVLMYVYKFFNFDYDEVIRIFIDVKKC